MAGKYVITKTADGQFMFNLKAANHEIILTSERYVAKAGAVNGIESVKTNSPNDAMYERKTSASNQPFFVLKSGNGEVIGRSEMYSSAAAMENGISSVKTNGPTAPPDDQSGT